MNPQELGAAGGTARAEALAPERRAEIARNAANTRWHREAARRADDGVRQHHGISALSNCTVRIWEGETQMGLRVFETGTLNKTAEAALTPAQARYLADQLFHLARRLDERAGR